MCVSSEDGTQVFTHVRQVLYYWAVHQSTINTLTCNLGSLDKYCHKPELCNWLSSKWGVLTHQLVVANVV
jgi:hypothetical protein